MKKRSIGLAIGIPMIVVLLSASVVSARAVVPGASIDGVHIGQGKASVKRVLGPPPHTQKGPPGSDTVRWDYKAHNSLTVLLVQGRVTRVFVTTIPGRGRVFDHTTKGIGLLSKMSAVRKAYPGHCEPPVPSMGIPPCATGTPPRRA